MTLNDEELKVTQRIIELGDKSKKVTTHDLPYIISDVLDSASEDQHVVIKSYVLTHAKGLQPSTTVSVEIDGELIEENASGDGQYDAFINALRKIYKRKEKNYRD